MDFATFAENNREEIIRKTQELVSIPSIEGTPRKGMPMGEDVDKALNYVLDTCRELGFQTKNLDGYAGYAEYGSGDEMVGILCHLDVVPAGEGWTKPPFGGVIEGDKLFGRGTTDNKGPAISAIYALKAVQEAKIPLQRRVRLIFGTNEESGWRGIKHYCEYEEMPTMAFVPDAQYPVINVEKGIAQLRLTRHGTEAKTSLDKPTTIEVLELKGGHRANMIPGICTCRLAGDAKALHSAADIARGLNRDPYPRIEVSLEGEVLTLSVMGLAGHGSTPDSGVNAIAHMAQVLHQIMEAGFTFDSEAVTKLLEFLTAHVGLETNGKSLGIGYSDEVSGNLTLSIGILRYEGGKAYVDFDIRYPVTKQLADIVDPIRDVAKNYGINVDIGHTNRSLHVPEESFLVKQLLSVYEKHSGEKAKPLSMGGGTYARALDNAVAFGSTMPGEERNIHREDEFTTITDLLRNTVIFADAITLLAGK
ncbi:MAG: dipeptidase PepV [Firmicutes bacterium]|nr:dipeptidase PepV [Bacillota bacterium]